MEKRRIPRHVDGRIKILLIPVKPFFLKVLPITIILVVIMLTRFNPITFFIGGLVILINIVLHCELNNKETAYDILKQLVKYRIDGNKYSERGCLNDSSTSKRRIRNKIKRSENQ